MNINSNLSLHWNADSREPFHGFAAAVATELHAPATSIPAAARSFYKDSARPDFETVESDWLNHPALSPVGSGSARIAFDKLGDHPPMTHWGINE